MAARISQKDIAAAVGLSRATVSMALKGHPRIAPETKQRIQEAVVRLGYTRDPMLSALAAYRLTRRPSAFQGAIAWLVSSAEGLKWRQIEEYRVYHQAASAQGAQLGYKLETIDLQSYRRAPARIAHVLQNRGIRGLLVCPMPVAHIQIELPLDRLSAVAFGYSLESPPLHRVAFNHYGSMVEIMNQLTSRGYRRIGYVINQEHNERLRGFYLAAYLFKQMELRAADRLPPLQAPDADLDALVDWERRHRPDAIITSRHQFATWPEALRARVPTALGVAAVSIESGSDALAGIDQCSAEIGRSGMQFLASLVERGERGVPELPQLLLSAGVWREGQSLPPRD